MDEGLKQTIERVKKQNTHVLPITNMVQHVPSDIQRLIVVAEQIDAFERERDGAMTLLGKQVMDYTLMKQRLDAVAVEAAKAHVRIHELETQLAGLLPAAQVLVSKVEFIPILASNAAPTIDDDLTLSGLQEDTNDVLESLDKTAIKGAINWADLRCVSTTKVHGNYGRTWFRVEIEEAAPGEEALIAAVIAGLAAKGWYTDDIEVTTEW